MAAAVIAGIILGTSSLGCGNTEAQKAKHLEKGGEYLEQSRYREAALKINPMALPPYILLGIICERQGDIEKAKDIYEKALEIDPGFAPIGNNLAWLYLEHGGDVDEALSLAQTAREKLREYPGVVDTLGWAYYKKGLYRKAIPLFQEIVEKVPKHPVFHYHLGMAYHNMVDRPALAKKELEESLRLSPDFPGAQEVRETLKMLEVKEQ